MASMNGHLNTHDQVRLGIGQVGPSGPGGMSPTRVIGPSSVPITAA
jgi:hypothetical protein